MSSEHPARDDDRPAERQERLLDILEKAARIVANDAAVDWLALCDGDSDLAADAETLAACLNQVDERLAEPLREEFPESLSLGLKVRIVRRLARGGQGNIYLARDEALKRDLAVKVSHWRDEQAAWRLRKEAQIASRLEHPGVVPVFGTGITRYGMPFLAMRYVRGTTLESLFSDASCDEASRSEGHARSALGALAETCRTLAFAHGRGIVHCDVKPANILIADSGGAVLLDWGVAAPSEGGSGPRPEEPVSDSSALRSHARRVGTVDYSSPKRFLPGAVIGPWVDVYSIGMILAQFVEGEPAERSANRSAGAPSRSLFPFDATVERRLRSLADSALDVAVDCPSTSALEWSDAIETLLRKGSLYRRRRFVVAWPYS